MANPKVNLPLAPIDLALEAICWAGAILLLLIPILFIADLPSEIPMHFNLAGEPDGMGEKSELWMMTAIGVGTTALLLLICRFPHYMNLPVTITEENAVDQYRIATRFMRIIGVAIVTLIAYISYSSVQIAMENQTTLNPIVLYVFLAVIIGLLVNYVFRAYFKNKKK